MAVVQVDHQHPAGLQHLCAVVVKALRAQPGRLALVVETVDQQHIARRDRMADEERAVAAQHVESLAVGRHAELVAQRDHMRVDLGHLDLRLRQVAVAELGQRSAAQPDHRDLARLGLEQQEAHHRSRVTQIERIRVTDLHPALDLTDREIQALVTATVVDEGHDMRG